MTPWDFDKFTIAWIIWVVWFIFWEAWALIDKSEPETLSEHVWALRNAGSLGVFLVGALVLWLAYHFIFEGRL